MSKGIDISQWQNITNFEDIKSDGINFIIPRSSYRQTVDPNFFYNVENIKRVGIEIPAVYHFIYALNEDDVIKNAQTAISAVKKAGLKDIYIFCDLEYDSRDDYKRKTGKEMTKDLINKFSDLFCMEIIKAGYKTGIYLNLDYYNNFYHKEIVDKYDIWLAQWGSGPSIDCVYHQTSSKGRVKGISGDVDLNTFIGKTKKKEKEKDTDMANVEKGLNWALSKWHGPKYIMGGGRNYDLASSQNQASYDCSSFVFVYLYVAGLISNRTRGSFRNWGNTEDLFKLRNTGICREISFSEVKRGDIFVSGDEGASAGAAGHTGIFLSKNEIIHMTPGPQRAYWTVITSNQNEYFNDYVGGARYFRYISAESGSNSISTSYPKGKSLQEVAKDVIAGKLGNGNDRKNNLEKAGYNYNNVQNEVNKILSGKKSDDDIAKEVIAGKYGVGEDRKKKLQSAGYNYDAIQKLVNAKLVAKKVLAGNYGNGQDRINKLKKAGYDPDLVQKEVNKLL